MQTNDTPTLTVMQTQSKSKILQSLWDTCGIRRWDTIKISRQCCLQFGVVFFSIIFFTCTCTQEIMLIIFKSEQLQLKAGNKCWYLNDFGKVWHHVLGGPKENAALDMAVFIVTFYVLYIHLCIYFSIRRFSHGHL